MDSCSPEDWGLWRHSWCPLWCPTCLELLLEISKINSCLVPESRALFILFYLNNFRDDSSPSPPCSPAHSTPPSPFLRILNNIFRSQSIIIKQLSVRSSFLLSFLQFFLPFVQRWFFKLPKAKPILCWFTCISINITMSYQAKKRKLNPIVGCLFVCHYCNIFAVEVLQFNFVHFFVNTIHSWTQISLVYFRMQVWVVTLRF